MASSYQYLQQYFAWTLLISIWPIYVNAGPGELLLQLENTREIPKKIDLLLKLSGLYVDLAKKDSAYLFANMAIELSQDSKHRQKVAESHYALGYAYDMNGNLENAITQYDHAQKIYEVLDIKKEVATCMNSKGVAAYFKGDFALALTFYLSTLEYVESNAIEDVMVNTLNNLGVIYRVTNKNQEAIETYYKTLSLSKKIANEYMIGTSYHNLGVAYNFNGDLDLSLLYMDSALQHYELQKDTSEIAHILTAIGEAYYMNKKKFGDAREYLLRGEKMLVNTGEQEILSKTYLLLAQLERDDDHYKKSESYFHKGLRLIEDTDRKDVLQDFYQEMEKLYVRQNDVTNAHKYLNKYLLLYKEIQSSEKLNAIEEIQTKYESAQKEQEIILLNRDKQVAAAHSKNLMIIASILAIGLGLLSLLVYRLTVLNKQVKKSASEKDTLLREIHHRVKNNLQVISALLTLQSKYLKDDQAIEALREGQDRVQSMALIHKDLYQHDNLKGVNTKDYLEKLVENLLESYQVNDCNIDLQLAIESIWLDVDTMIPLGLLINELVSNALKHAFKNRSNGKLSISLKEENERLLLMVSDDGFDNPTFSGDGQGSFGKSLIDSFSKKLQADITYSYEDGYVILMKIKEYKKAA